MTAKLRRDPNEVITRLVELRINAATTRALRTLRDANKIQFKKIASTDAHWEGAVGEYELTGKRSDVLRFINRWMF